MPAINSGRVDLLDSDRLVAQLIGLERRTARAGKDSIDHAPAGHDDLANAVAGAVHMVLSAHTNRPRISICGPIIVTAEPERVDLNFDPGLRAFYGRAMR